MSAQPEVGDDLEMMQRPPCWPCWPMLPVKRTISVAGADKLELGLMFVAEVTGPAEPVVWLANVIEGVTADTKRIVYQDLNGIIDAGWIVD